MTLYKVVCINKIVRNDPYTRIQFVGVVNRLGQSTKFSVEKVIRDIQMNIAEYFVDHCGMEVRVVVATSPHGNLYIRTEADDVTCNNLLSLPECG